MASPFSTARIFSGSLLTGSTGFHHKWTLFTSISVNTGECFLRYELYDTGNIKTEMDRKGDRHGEENRHSFRFLPFLNEQ